MIQLIGLSEKPEYYEPMPTSFIDFNIPDYNQMICRHLGAKAPKDEDSAIAIYEIGSRIRKAGDSIALENADFKIVEDACKENNGKFVAHLQGQLLLKIRGWKAGSPAGAVKTTPLQLSEVPLEVLKAIPPEVLASMEAKKEGTPA